MLYSIDMFGDDSLTLREFAMREPLPLATIHDAILDFLRNRDDAVLFGAQAVNAYVDEPRMTQDVDIHSTRAAGAGRSGCRRVPRLGPDVIRSMSVPIARPGRAQATSRWTAR